MENHLSEVKIDLADIPSSFLSRIQFAGTGNYGELTVSFRKGYQYLYNNVQLGHVIELLTAVDDMTSVGELFGALIRSNYEGQRLEVNA